MSDRVVVDGDVSLTSTIDGEGGAYFRIGQNPVIEALNVTANGTYEAPEGVDGYSPVTVDVPLPLPVIEPLDVTENGVYAVPEGVDGYSPVTVALPEYEGAYEVEPSTEEQTLATAGKVMTRDVTVAPTDLYPIWTDIVGLYAGRNIANGQAPFVTNHTISTVTGEVIESDGSSALYEYLQVSDSYTYCKNNYRIYGIWCYDADKNYIGRAQGDGGYNNTSWRILPQLPQGTHYIRIVTHQLYSNYYLAIYRTA